MHRVETKNSSRKKENKADMQKKRKSLKKGHNLLSVLELSDLILFLFYGNP